MSGHKPTVFEQLGLMGGCDRAMDDSSRPGQGPGLVILGLIVATLAFFAFVVIRAF